MPEITGAAVKKIARLANIKLNQEESSAFAGQLEHILEYINKLNQLDTTGVAQTAHALPLQNVWRDDQVQPGLTRDQALAAAPEIQDGCFRVPRIIE